MASTFQRLRRRLCSTIVTRRRTGGTCPIRRLTSQAGSATPHRRVSSRAARRVSADSRLDFAASNYLYGGATVLAPRIPAPSCTSSDPRRRRAGLRPCPRTRTSPSLNRRRCFENKLTGILAWPTAGSRTLRFGIRFHVVAREHERRQAWSGVRTTAECRDRGHVAAGTRPFCASESTGQPGCRRCHERYGTGARQRIWRSTRRPGPAWAGWGGGAGNRACRQPCRGGRPHPGVRALGSDGLRLLRIPAPEEPYWVGEGVLPDCVAVNVLRPLDGLVAADAASTSNGRRLDPHCAAPTP